MPALSDVRYALRLFARTPIFTATAVASLALGVAASAAIFSIADAVLLRPRAGIADPPTLVDVGRTTRREGFDTFGYPLFAAMREHATLLDGLAAQRFSADVMSLGDAHASTRVFASLVSGNFFEVLGTRPALGRFFLPEEDQVPDAHAVVVLTHEFWTRRFNQDPAVLQQTLRLNNRPYAIVGVAEEGFSGTTVMGTDFWVPMAMEQHVRAGDRSLLDMAEASWLMAVGRLKPGVTPPQARDELGAIMQRFMTERNDPRRDRWGVAVALSTRVPAPIAGPVTAFIGMLGALTGLVLLIACSNIAAMLLARGLERRREVATRLAVGATRRRILGQLLLEGLTLAIVAGVLSIPLAAALVGLLSSLQPSLPLPIALDLRVDPRVTAFAFALAALTAIAFALLPAVQATRFDVAPALHGANATMDRRRAWLRQALVGGQVAMALLLLVAAGLFLRSLQTAATTDTGYNVEHVDLLQIDTAIAGYRSDAEGVRVVESVLDRLRTVPGVTDAAASRMVPLLGGGLGLGALRAPGYSGRDGSDRVEADWDTVSPEYFRTLQLEVVHGRPFGPQDRAGARRVAIVNERLAAEVWPGQNPIGRTLLQQTGRDPAETAPLEIVGVARMAKYRSIGETPRNFIYVPLAQQYLSDITLYVRRGPGGSRLGDLREAIAAFDRNLPVIHAQTLREATAVSLLPQRLAAWIAGSVGTIGLLLAALGLYGLTAFAVTQRARELAVRMALGATRRDVVSLVVGQSARLALIGTATGLALAAGVSQLLQSLLIGLGPIDPLAFGLATLALGGVLVAASWAPARRAARMDPVRALRAE